jgi:hypothetical protein
MRYYTYCILGKDGRFYYGSRQCDCDPKVDLYAGSCKDPTFVPIRKRILREFSCDDLAVIEEMRIHVTKNVGPNPRYANGATLRPKGMSRRGVIVSEESREKMRQSRLGKTHSEETLKKIRKPVSLRRISDGSRLDFESQSAAAAKLGISRGNLSRMVSGQRQSLDGFTIWTNE